MNSQTRSHLATRNFLNKLSSAIMFLAKNILKPALKSVGAVRFVLFVVLGLVMAMSSVCAWAIPAASAIPAPSAIPARPNPPRLVNDLANIFTPEQVARMEQALVVFADSTSNQIAVVTVPELYGMDKAQLAISIGEQWGIGQEKFDNGVVILVKPKMQNAGGVSGGANSGGVSGGGNAGVDPSAGKGEVFIATGYGLEGVLTDAVCRRIIEQKMIPYFRNNDYYSGVVNALNTIMPLAAGEISSSEFANSEEGSSFGASLFLLFVVFLFIALLAGGKNDSQNMGGGGRNNRHDPSVAELLILSSILSGGGRSHRNGGGYGGGFGSGGFGGFGGGSFGGGGAGGSW